MGHNKLNRTDQSSMSAVPQEAYHIARTKEKVSIRIFFTNRGSPIIFTEDTEANVL